MKQINISLPEECKVSVEVSQGMLVIIYEPYLASGLAKENQEEIEKVVGCKL